MPFRKLIPPFTLTADEEMEEFYLAGVLGKKRPRALLNTVWINNCIYFGMRPGQEQRDLCWGPGLELKTNADYPANRVSFDLPR